MQQLYHFCNESLRGTIRSWPASEGVSGSSTWSASRLSRTRPPRECHPEARHDGVTNAQTFAGPKDLAWATRGLGAAATRESRPTAVANAAFVRLPRQAPWRPRSDPSARPSPARGELRRDRASGRHHCGPRFLKRIAFGLESVAHPRPRRPLPGASRRSLSRTGRGGVLRSRVACGKQCDVSVCATGLGPAQEPQASPSEPERAPRPRTHDGLWTVEKTALNGFSG